MTLKASICIDAVLEQMSTTQAMQLAAELGYPAIEFWKWWEKDIDELLRTRDALGLQIAACCTRFVSLVDPSRRDEYLEGLAESVQVAQRLGCPTLISQVGDFRPGVPRQEQHACLVEGLQAAVGVLSGSGVTLAIEPLNELIDHPGYYLVRSSEAFEIVAAVNHPQIKVTFDIYHQQISEGHIIANLQADIEHIAHFHAAGNPGRHELTRGELDYPAIFDSIRQTSFDGFVGLEYWPVEAPEIGLREVAQWFPR